MHRTIVCLSLRIGVAVIVAASISARAAVFNVDTNVDDPSLGVCDAASPNDCSLRGAIAKANALTEPVTINVPAGRYVLSQATPCSFRGNDVGPLFSSLGLCVVGNVTIVGAGSDATIIDANQPAGANSTLATVMFIATTANATIRGATIRGGNYSASTLIGTGGGVNNAGTLAVVDSVISDNWTAGSGGGVFNTGDVTLLRSVVTRNLAGADGGGIFSHTDFSGAGHSTLAVADSSISENQAVANGGAIFNFSGIVGITGSTLAGNIAHGGSGGAIFNGLTLSLTNVTVSGNRGASAGGIFNSGVSWSTIRMNNVTVANNTAQLETEPASGIGGGLVSAGGGSVTLGNTIIAGNFAAGSCGVNGCTAPGNDCFAVGAANGALTSLGYNLIQNADACDIAGDTTGNITGKDARLGILAGNDGPTSTHALAADSPAIDAGNPASPGSGGSACAAIDQRRFLRPIGVRCDIGAFERSGALSIASVSPSSGGNTGQVSVRIDGAGFVDAASVRLSRAGQPDIAASRVHIDIGGASMAAAFDLTGAAVGAWDVTVTNADATTRTLPAGFTIQPGVGPNLWVDVVGFIKRHGPGVVTVYYGNRGDVDAIGVPLTLSVPQGYGAGRYFAIASPPPQPGQVVQNFDFVPPIVVEAQDSFLQLPLLLPIVPTGFSGVLRIAFAPVPPDAKDSFLLVAIGAPLFTAGVTAEYIDDGVAGAQAYVQQAFGITIPTTVIPALQRYLSAQTQLVIANGEAVFDASLGTDPLVYSAAQLHLDLAAFAVAAALPAAP